MKAYKAVVGGFVYTIRFKACLGDQPAIDFQTVIYQGIRRKLDQGKKDAIVMY